MITKLKQLVEVVKKMDTVILAVAAAEDEDVLKSVMHAKKENIIKPILIGDIEKINQIATKLNESLEGVELIRGIDLKDSAMKAVKLVSSGKAHFVMKGLLDTSILLKEVLNKEYGLKDESLLSHVMVYEVKNYNKLLILTDGGMNISPDLEQKKYILKNAIKAANALNIDNIKVACITAKEKVSDKMIATVDANSLKELGNNAFFGECVTVEGPIAFDLAVSKQAAQIKDYKSEVCGDVDIMLFPTIECGNSVGKALTYMADAKCAGVIMGAKVPVVLVSRADSQESKLYSIALGAIIANKKD